METHEELGLTLKFQYRSTRSACRLFAGEYLPPAARDTTSGKTTKISTMLPMERDGKLCDAPYGLLLWRLNFIDYRVEYHAAKYEGGNFTSSSQSDIEDKTHT